MISYAVMSVHSHCHEVKMLCPVTQAKESWEMNSSEKLEQSVIVKEKGTQYFKVQAMSCKPACIYALYFILIYLNSL